MPGDINTRLKLALAFLAAFPSSAAAAETPKAQFPNWSVSFQPGVTDADGHYLGATEIRDLVAFNGKLYASNSYWMDQSGAHRDAQVFVLDGPDAKWRQDVEFKDALATGALAKLNFKRDAGGDNINVDVLVASIWPQGKKPEGGHWIRTYSKNNSDGLWYESRIAQTTGNAQVRSLGSHQDTVTKDAYAFAAGGDIGIYHGVLTDTRGAGKAIIEWTAAPEYLFPDSEGK